MNAEELELLGDSKYRNYVAAVDKALKNFEYSSEWADLISALGKLNKVLQNNAKYQVVPKKLTIGKRLAQCLHPALPSGVHRKALETYEIIFKIIGPKRLAKDLFLYSSGLFPLLSNAAMSVKPVLLGLYETYYLPLGKTLKPGLQGLLTGVLPGLEEGSEYYDRTNTLLEKVAAAVEQAAFYSALWGSILTSPAVRLPGVSFVLLHLNRKLSMEDQLYIMGSDIELMVEAVSTSVQDSSVLVQRSTLDLILFCFPFHMSQATRPDMIRILSAALHVVLRRDMSLNRRLYAWLLGKELAMVGILQGKARGGEEESVLMHDLKPFRILISLLDKPELGIKLRENKKTAELIKTANLLFNSFEPYYMWDYIARWFEECCRFVMPFIIFVNILTLLVTFLKETYIEIQTEHLPQLLLRMVSALTSHLQALQLDELTQCLRLCSKILSKVQPPLVSPLTLPQGASAKSRGKEEKRPLSSPLDDPGGGEVFEERETTPPSTKACESGFTDFIQYQDDRGVDPDRPHHPSTPPPESGVLEDLPIRPALRAGIDSAGPGSHGNPQDKTVMQCCLEHFQQFLSRLVCLYVTPDRATSMRTENLQVASVLVDGVGQNGVEQQQGLEHRECLAAFTAACQLFLECSSFPVYIAEGNLKSSPICLFVYLGVRPADGESVRPLLWLETLMDACCSAADFSIQAVAISLVMDLVGLTQSVAMVTAERISSPDSTQPMSPSQGRVAVVIRPPLTQGILKYIAEKTVFFKNVALILWDQLGEGTPLHHQRSVELFYQLHNLVPSSSICEDVISQQLMHRDKRIRLEAHVKFSVLWHLTRDLNITKSSPFNRTFDRSLFIMLDSLIYWDGSASAVGRAWLNQVLQRHDIARILEPLLLLLLHPKTHRVSIQRVQSQRHWAQAFPNPPEADGSNSSTADNGSFEEPEGSSSTVNTLDRALARVEAVTAEDEDLVEETVSVLLTELVDRVVEDSSSPSPPEPWPLTDSESTNSSSDTSSGTQQNVSPFNSNQNMTLPELAPGAKPKVKKAKRKQAPPPEKSRPPGIFFGDSLDLENWYSCGEGEVSEIESDAGSPRTPPARFNIHPLYQHVLLYLQLYDSSRALHALTAVAAMLRASPSCFVGAISTTSINNTYTPQLSLLQNLLARHRVSVMGKDFYCPIPQDSHSHSFRSAMFLEIIISLCLYFLRSYYAAHVAAAAHDLAGNRAMQLTSVEVLTLLFTELAKVTGGSAKGFACFISDVLSKCKVQKVVLHCLLSSIFSAQKWHEQRTGEKNIATVEEGLSEDSVINLSEDQLDSCSALQSQLLRLLQSLVVLEHRLLGGEVEHVNPQQPMTSLQYLHGQPITAQGMFLCAVIRALHQHHACKMHPQWIGLITATLPYMGKVLRRVVASVTLQLCRNLDNLMQQYYYETGLSDTRYSISTLDTNYSAHNKVTRGNEQFVSWQNLRQQILELLGPISMNHGAHFMAAIAYVWNERKQVKNSTRNKVIPTASEEQLLLVELVRSVSAMRTETVMQTVKEVLKQPPAIAKEKKHLSLEVCMLQFFYAYVQRIPISSLVDSWSSLIALLKESVQLGLPAPGQFLLLGVLNEFILKNPNLENKKDQRELQDVTHKIVEAIGTIAGSSLEQTTWLRRNLEVKPSPQIVVDGASLESDVEDLMLTVMEASNFTPSVYSVHALTLLAEVLAHLLDMVFYSDEKERVIPLLVNIMHYVVPYLRNHSAHNAPSYRACIQLLSSLSGYQYTRRAWKKEAFDLFMDHTFFQMDSSCVSHWRAIIDHLMTHDKTTFRDLMIAVAQSSSLSLFTNRDAELEQRAMLLKRLAFTIYSSEVDQYQKYLPDIQERLVESLRLPQVPILHAQVFLFFRVLLLRMSPQHLTSLWPTMITELVRDPHSIYKVHTTYSGGNGFSTSYNSQRWLNLYLSACKLLDLALTLPSESLPQFQMCVLVNSL
uniref:Dopey N-terminal domain-containing protein n=1 Tax=Denticeps clupeoides TaxID=299321 RepID=A0AAY4AEP0_9TELE